MISLLKPTSKPNRPLFSSGPCVKPFGWGPEKIDSTTLGRSHRSDVGIALFEKIIGQMRSLLRIPDGYAVAIVPGSATGACEIGLWNLLGSRPVDVFSWDVFSKKWLEDIRDQLRISHRSFDAEFGKIPDLSVYDPAHDCCFAWSGTTAGVQVPHADWIPSERSGIVICDATSAMFSFYVPWEKLDFTAFSFQKVIGSEAAHGVIVLSPRALERLERERAAWPIPSLLNLRHQEPVNGSCIKWDLFQGKPNNTPSMLCVSDISYCLDWLESIGGLDGAIKKTARNRQLIEDWVEQRTWITFLSQEAAIRSQTTLTLVPTHHRFQQATESEKWSIIQTLCKRLADEKAAYDIKGHAQAVPHIRIWCGPTVEAEDIAALLPWLDYMAQELGLTY